MNYVTRTPTDFVSRSAGFGPAVGLTQHERGKYNLASVVRALVMQDRAKLANFLSISREICQVTGQPDAGHLYCPREFFDAPESRALSTVPGSKGGYLVQASAVSFNNALARRSVIGQLPLTRIEVDQVGSVVRAQLATQNSVVWISENTQATPAEGTLGNIAMTGKMALAAVDVSEQLFRQTEQAVATYAIDQQLGQAVGEAYSTALLTGAGAAEPLGIFSTPGIDTRTGASYDMAAAAAMIKVAEAYDDGDSVIAVGSLDGAETLRRRAKVSGGERFIVEDRRLLDAPFVGTRAMSGARLVVAPWANVVMCTWGALEIDVDTSGGFNSLQRRVRLIGLVDFSAERPAQVAVATAIT
jgi:hypothetical protein